MERRNLLFIIGGILGVLVLGAGFYKVLANKKEGGGKMGALQVTSVPKARVFVDDKEAGTTPYSNEELKSGEYTIKLVPVEPGPIEWIGKAKVSVEVLTFVNRTLGNSSEFSAGEILSLEKLGSREESELAVVSLPSGVGVKLDGMEKGVSPLLLKEIAPGDHEVSLEATGFEPRVIRARTVPGFKLTAVVDLAKRKEEDKAKEESKEEGVAPTPKKTIAPSPKVAVKAGEKLLTILETPTDWLRVRSGPGTGNEELTKVKPGEVYPYSETEKGWYHIRYKSDSDGWVSGDYVQVKE